MLTKITQNGTQRLIPRSQDQLLLALPRPRAHLLVLLVLLALLPLHLLLQPLVNPITTVSYLFFQPKCMNSTFKGRNHGRSSNQQSQPQPPRKGAWAEPEGLITTRKKNYQEANAYMNAERQKYIDQPAKDEDFQVTVSSSASISSRAQS